MEPISFLTYLLTAVLAALSIWGFNNLSVLEKNSFIVGKILTGKEYHRLFTSGFFHVNWMHLLFNALALYSFGEFLELSLGVVKFTVIFISSLLGGNLLALFIHRNHEDYSAIGASGAISGLLFAGITLFPGMELGLIVLPISLPAWLFGILFVSVSIYGIKTQKGNIGHEAHLGGGITGLIVAICYYPAILRTNLTTILIVAVPSILFLLLIVFKPSFLLLNGFSRGSSRLNLEEKYNTAKHTKQQEINEILDKIGEGGIESLSKKDRKRLDELSK